MKAKRAGVHNLLCALTVVTIVGVRGGLVHGGDYYIPVTSPGSIFVGGQGATPVSDVVGKEYSHNDWFEVVVSGGDPRLDSFYDHDPFGGFDPGQVVSWDGLQGPIGGNSGSTAGFDYPVESIQGSSGQVDALANHNDYLFHDVIENRATLLFSGTTDLDVTSVIPGGPLSPLDHVHYEDPVGGHATWAAIEAPPVNGGPGPGVNHHMVRDVDGLEVWGPEPPAHTSPDSDPVHEGYVGPTITADAERFSMDKDATTGISVWGYDTSSKSIFPYIPLQDVILGVESAFNYNSPLSDETRRVVDVDATMAHDQGVIGEWDPGDELLFSIDPIDEPILADGTAVSSIDGGEIIHMILSAGGGISAEFLKHGGHVWDTAFDVRGTFDYLFEDIDALEAVGTRDGEEISLPPCQTLLPGDGNGDCWVDGLDYLVWASNFGAHPGPDGDPSDGDYNDDGWIDGLDYLLWAANYGSHAAGTAVPEPATVALMLVGLVSLVRKRWR